MQTAGTGNFVLNGDNNFSDLTTNGAGTVSLGGNNTFSGLLAVNAGTLRISGAGQLESGTYAGSIAIGGTLR